MTDKSYSFLPDIEKIRATFEAALQSGSLIFMEEDDLMELIDYYGLKLNNEKMAEQALEYTLRLYPDSLDAHIAKAQSLLSHGNLSGAKAIYENILDKTDEEVLYLKADIFMAEERIDKAQATFREIARMQGGFSEDCGLDFAQECLDFGYLDEAVEWLERVLKLNPDNMSALEQLCTLLQGFYDRIPEAIVYANHYLDLDPFSAQMWAILARLHFINKDEEECLTAADFCLTLDKQNHTGLLIQTLYKYSPETAEESKKTLAYLFDNFQPEDSLLLERYAIGHFLFLCQIADNEISEARITHERNYRYYMEDEEAEEKHKYELDRELGLLLLKEDRIEEAYLVNNKLTDNGNVPLDIKLEIGQAYTETGLFPWALEVFRHLLPSHPGEAACYMAYCFLQMQDEKQYFYYLKKGCDMCPRKAKELFGSHFPDNLDPSGYYDYACEHWQGYKSYELGPDDFEPVD